MVILLIVIPLVLAGVLFVFMSNMESEEGSTSVIITAKSPQEKTYGFLIEITKTSGTLDLEEAKFQVVDNQGLLVYSVTIQNSNPAPFSKGQSWVYPMTLGTSPVTDGISTVNGDDALSAYEGCYIAFIDQNQDEKINSGDSLYIYKDNNNDGINDIKSNYSIRIMSRDEMVMNKVL